MAVDTPAPPAAYSPEKGIQREAKEDGARVRNELELNGPEAAARRMWDEVQAVPEKDRDAYSQLLLKELDTNGTARSILPELAISFGMLAENRDKVLSKDSWTSSERVLSEEKIREAYKDKNPLARALFNELHNQYFDLRKEVSDNQPAYKFLNSPHIYESKLNEVLAHGKQQAENRRDFGLLATNEKLFKGISGGDKGLNGQDGEITRDDVIKFKQQWDKDPEFRKQYLTNDTQKEQVDKLLMNLISAFDDPRNKDNKPGSLLKDNVVSHLRTEFLSPYGKMTQQSLLEGLGYKTLKEAQERLPIVKNAEKPLPDVTTLPNYDNTRLGRNEGPYQVTRRMLDGQDQFFKDAPGGKEKAQRDLMEAMGIKNKVFNDKQGANQVTAENRNQIIENIKATGNKALLDWFMSRYPAEAGGRPQGKPVEPAANYNDSIVKPDTRSRTVAQNMLRDSGLDEKATQALADVLGSVWIRNNVGKPLLSDNNLERVRDKIKATGNKDLYDWFNKRYPIKNGGHGW